MAWGGIEHVQNNTCIFFRTVFEKKVRSAGPEIFESDQGMIIEVGAGLLYLVVIKHFNGMTVFG